MEAMEVSDIHVEKNRKLGGYEAKVSGHHVTNGESGHFIEVTAWGGTQERALEELCDALRRVDFGLSPDDDPGEEMACAA